MISEDGVKRRKEAILLSKLNLVHIEDAISSYPYKQFYVKGIRVQLQKMYDLVVDLNGDTEKVIGNRIRSAIASLSESGRLRLVVKKGCNHGFLYEKKY